MVSEAIAARRKLETAVSALTGLASPSWRAQPPDLRIGTVERAGVVDALQQHLSDGRLDLEEFEDRAGQAFAAKTVGDLDRLMTDLPPLPALPRPAPAAAASRRQSPGRRSIGVRWSVVAPWLIVNVLMVLLWVAGGTHSYPWPLWVMVPWGLAVLPRAWRFTGERPARLERPKGQ